MPAYTKSPTYLVRNRHSYCFRMIVPADLRKFVGRKELRYTLRTGYVGLAKSKARLLAGQLQQFFGQVREIIKMGELTDDQIVERVNRYFRGFIDGLEKIRVEPGAICKGKVFRDVDLLIRSVGKNAQKALIELDYTYAWSFVAGILRAEGLEIEKFTAAHNKMSREVLKAIIRFSEIEERRNRGDYSDDLTKFFPLTRDKQIPAKLAAPETAASETVEKVFEAFWDENAPNWKPRTRTQYQTCHNHLTIFLGLDQPIRSIDYEAGRRYKAQLAESDTNRGKKMSPARVDLYLGYASQLFNWALKHHYVDVNPFSGLQFGKKKRKRADAQREAFSIADLRALFVDSPYFGQDNWGRANQPHFFWIPLIGLYTGAREEEIGQLNVADVRQEKGIWVLDIREGPMQSIKTSERRLVPLHDFIVDELRFIDYVQSLPKDGRVFPQLKYIQDRYTHSFSQWFGRFKRRCGIAENKTFHSFRHTITTHLLECATSLIMTQFPGKNWVTLFPSSRF